jgi:hypothetical protein
LYAIIQEQKKSSKAKRPCSDVHKKTAQKHFHFDVHNYFIFRYLHVELAKGEARYDLPIWLSITILTAEAAMVCIIGNGMVTPPSREPQLSKSKCPMDIRKIDMY